jgi:alanine racemase
LPDVTRPTVAEINLAAIRSNVEGIRRKVGPQVKIMAVVKANAYGHGIVEVAKNLQQRAEADYFGVALPEEGALLRQAGITAPILVFTLPTKKQSVLYTEFDLEATVCSLNEAELLDEVSRTQRHHTPVHLKIETGMNRIGVQVNDLSSFLTHMGKFRNLDIQGVYTHLATTDEEGRDFAHQQLGKFTDALDTIASAGIQPSITHVAGSWGILDFPESYFSLVRPGVILYGYYPSQRTSTSIALQAALRLSTSVSLVKTIESGESVGYGRKFVASRRTSIATLPIGYGDGVSRLLSGNMSVLIQGNVFPVVGTIGMDQMMVDIGNADIAVHDEAVIIGTQGARSISAWDLAESIGTIPYEICCWISHRVPRSYTNL